MPHPDFEISPYGFGNAPRGADPMGPTGQITNTYQPSPQAMLFGRVLEALQDPRNAWIGLGGIGRWRGLGRMFRPSQPARETGGFNVPTTQMKRDVPDLGLAFKSPMEEPTARTEYLRGLLGINQDAQMMTQGQPYLQMGRESYDMSGPARQEAINRTLVGRSELESEMKRRIFGLGNTSN